MGNTSILNQDEIDSLMNQMKGGSTMNNVVNPFTTSQKQQKQTNNIPQMRCYDLCYPILYANEQYPKYFNKITIYELWNSRTSTWEFHHKSEKLHYMNGMPVNKN